MKFYYLENSEISYDQLSDVINLKKVHWNYSIEEHFVWVKENLNTDDIHVLMIENDVLVGYLNLVRTEVLINDNLYNFFGIGNVCSRKKNMGYGKTLLIEVNNYLLKNSCYGILLCKESLIDFYKKADWKLLDKDLLKDVFSDNVNVMLFNFIFEVSTFNFSGRNF
jgi:hypothetical protein